MRKLLFCLVFAASLAQAKAPGVELFTASVQGDLVIGPSGDVIDARIDEGHALGDEVVQGYLQKIRAWRFEPVLEDGKPVNAKARMRLDLMARRDRQRNEATFGIRRVEFLDPPGTVPSAADQVHFDSRRLRMPVFPPTALRGGVSAYVMMVLRLRADGSVSEITTEQLMLFGPATNDRVRNKLAQAFRQSAETAAMHWRYSGSRDGDIVRAPIKYTGPEGDTGWRATAVVPVEPAEWALVELAKREALEFDAAGQPVSTRLSLLTPLDPAPATAAEG